MQKLGGSLEQRRFTPLLAKSIYKVCLANNYVRLKCFKLMSLLNSRELPLYLVDPRAF